MDNSADTSDDSAALTAHCDHDSPIEQIEVTVEEANDIRNI